MKFNEEAKIFCSSLEKRDYRTLYFSFFVKIKGGVVF